MDQISNESSFRFSFWIDGHWGPNEVWRPMGVLVALVSKFECKCSHVTSEQGGIDKDYNLVMSAHEAISSRK
jgi:hypothetical protein